MNCFVSLPVIFLLLLKYLHAQENYEKVLVEAVTGQSAELPCNVTSEKEDDKLNILAWYRNGSTTAFYSRDFRDGAELNTSSESRYRLVTAESAGEDKLQIIKVRPADAGLYTCLADFAASPAHRTYVELTVIEPPRVLWMVHENGTQVAKASPGVNTSQNVGPYYVGDSVHFACVAYGGKPLASLAWWTEQRLLKNTLTPLSEHRVRSDLNYGPLQREDHGRVFTCFAKNNEKTKPLSIDVTIDMYLPPDLVSLRTDGPDSEASVQRVRAGETLSLQCRVLGARPMPAISWRLDDNQLLNLEQKITMEPSQRLVVSEIQLTIDRHHDEAHITCCTPANQRNGERLVCAQPLPLTVLYAPVLEVVVDGDVENHTLTVVQGANISLACNHQANPSVYEVVWFHKEDIMHHSSRDAIQQILELTNVTEDDAGEYACVATNNEGTTYSDPLVVDVTYPAYCNDENIIEYGFGENDAINITCNVKANPKPSSYRWIILGNNENATTATSQPQNVIETDEPTHLFEKTTETAFSTILCWGQNEVPTEKQLHSPCTFIVTDETIPQPPTNCQAKRNIDDDIIITVTCEKGHDGGIPQKFKFIVKQSDDDAEQHLVLMSVVNSEPTFMIPEPTEDYNKFVILAFNKKGESKTVEIGKDSIIDEREEPRSVVGNITTLALALYGGVALVALAACGLVLYTYERATRADLPRDRDRTDPPLCAYNTEESNCETYHDSDDGSECNVKRTESFRKAVSRHPSKNFDVRRTSSFHSARYMNDMAEQENYNKPLDISRHSNTCRVHSLQNINRKRDMDMCDHLVLHLPPETNYNVSRPMNTFYTMPRKMRHKLAKELSDETSEITQTSDGFSLPPPPDEFGTYRAATRIKDMPTKSTPTYTAVVRNSSTGRDPPKQQYNNVIISPMNTVGLPTISGGVHSGVYSYPDDDHQGPQVTTNPFDEDSS